jgi:hypothetical protein
MYRETFKIRVDESLNVGNLWTLAILLEEVIEVM